MIMDAVSGNQVPTLCFQLLATLSTLDHLSEVFFLFYFIFSHVMHSCALTDNYDVEL